MINHQEAINPYNILRGLKSMEVHECEFVLPFPETQIADTFIEGLVMSTPELHAQYFDEYSKLMTQEKEALCKKWEMVHSTNIHLHHDMLQVKIQDVANVMWNMKMLVSELHTIHFKLSDLSL